MWFKLNNQDFLFHLKIDKYIPNKDLYDAPWCKVSLHCNLADIINYNFINRELLLTTEVDTIKNDLENLLTGKLKKDDYYCSIDNDLEFNYYPNKESSKINMELKIFLMDSEQVITTNYICLDFDRTEIELLYNYFLLITNEISIEDENIQSMIETGVLYFK